MANSFYRVSRSLQADRGLRSNLFLLTGLALLSAWLVWAFQARITRYEVSESARLEVDSAAFPVQANVSGELIYSAFSLGKQVHAGDVLARLDDSGEVLARDEERTKLASIQPEVAALQGQIESESTGRGEEHNVVRLSVEAAQSTWRDADAQAALAEKESARANELRSQGIIAAAEGERAKVAAQSKRAVAESLRVQLNRLEPELRVRDRDREVRIRQVSEQIAKLGAEMATSQATVRRLDYQIERRKIRARVDGQLTECAALHAGSHVSEGEQLGVILPQGRLQVIAEFQPSAALGKLRPGQLATVRLQGFPWAQYGTIGTRVSRVAGEVRDGKVRVELSVLTKVPATIPAQHGLPGAVEIEVEKISPASLVLRSAGSWIRGASPLTSLTMPVKGGR